MKIFYIVIFILTSVCTISCKEAQEENKRLTKYDVNKPDDKQYLSPALHEISGIAIIEDNKIACIQDEKGVLRVFDFKTGRYILLQQFAGDGDYEDIALVGDSVFVLRSDGTLFQFNFKNPEMETKKYETGIPAKDIEGLCYDKKSNRLLIGTKSKIEKGIKAIYEFDLGKKELNPNPFISFDTDKLEKEIVEKGFRITYEKKGLKLKISAIAINPKDNNLYLLSASEYLIFVFDMKGNLKEVCKLNPELHTKAEGIAFYENGDMLISNEGVDKDPTILLIKYNEK